MTLGPPRRPVPQLTLGTVSATCAQRAPPQGHPCPLVLKGPAQPLPAGRRVTAQMAAGVYQTFEESLQHNKDHGREKGEKAQEV